VRVLLTNDDGVFSPGLHALESALGQKHEVWVLAPDRERSGVGQSITFSDALRVRRLDDHRFAASGTPADCTILAMKGDFVPRPDVVVSGINAGPNLGTDVLYSGTAAGARQAVLMKVPGVAVSLNRFGFDSDFTPAAALLAEHLEQLVSSWEEDFFYNLNVPEELRHHGLFEGSLCRRVYHDRIDSFTSPTGERFCFVVGKIATEPAPEPESDGGLMLQGKASMTKVMAQPSVWNHDR